MIPFRIRILASLLFAALAPLAAFGVLLVITGRVDSDGSLFRILLTSFVIAALLGLGIAFMVAGSLTAIDAADSKAELLDEVAEDYVTKPYHYPELRARINRVLRRLGDRLPGQRIVLGSGLALELGRRAATVNGAEVSLTPTESRLLYALAANMGQTVPTETLLARGWADTDGADPSYVWVTMRRLRQKIEPDANRPRHLITVRGIGYRLEADPT
jgi:DNA-binding response OmpR family regulator